MATSRKYWRQRIESEMRAKQLADLSIKEEYDRLASYYINRIESEINNFYAKYAYQNQVEVSEVKKIAGDMDVEAFAEKAKRYVSRARRIERSQGRKATNSDYTKWELDQLELYNLKMKVSRLELLQYNLELEAADMELDEFQLTERFLEKSYVEEVRLQAGILGETVPAPETLRSMAQAVIDTPYEGAVWSSRIWDRQDALRSVIADITAEAIFKGKNPLTFVTEIKKEFDVNSYQARRLAITEMARVQTAVQKDSYKRNDFREYEYMPEPTACDNCGALRGKTFKVKDMEPGLNAPPLHPFCHCATSPHESRDQLEAMFDE